MIKLKIFAKNRSSVKVGPFLCWILCCATKVFNTKERF